MVVRRATLLLGAGLVLFAGVFAWLVRDEPAAPGGAGASIADGARLFQQYCGECHAADDLRTQLRDGGAFARGRAETFLRDHGDATDAEDLTILDYLAAADTR
ncbi:MAG: hypothetical protein A3H29_10890 [Acidobacteria bacterium RIFCSPLOWO2_02_FULL_67_21]|nr:MAG: hypothetical protein A3H29_10890 [Acidobacteria bacterium RIFCSPLOWO2_02_FULL_67_21]